MNKKNTHYILIFLWSLLILIAITGCSSKGPTSNVLNSDLATYLQAYYPFLNIEGYNIDQSITEDRNYTASILVTASNEYAKYDLIANIDYTKYDQGWECSYCDWTIANCTVTNWPTEAQMEDFLYNRALQVDEYMRYPAYSRLSNDGQSTIMYEGSINAEYAGFVGIKGSVVSYWNYIPQDGTFRFERDDSEVSLILTKNIEGTWKDERMSTSRNPYYFIITDQGEDHFTIEYTYEDIKDTVYISTENLSDFEESYERLAFSKKASLEYKVDIEIYESGAGQYTLQYRTNFAGHNYNYNTWAYITN